MPVHFSTAGTSSCAGHIVFSVIFLLNKLSGVPREHTVTDTAAWGAEEVYRMKSASARSFSTTTERELDLPEVFTNVNGYTRSRRDSGLSTSSNSGPYRSNFNGKPFRWQDRPQSSLELLQEIDELCRVPEQPPGFRMYSRSPSRKKRRGFRIPVPSMSNMVTVYIPFVGVCSYEALSLHLVHKAIFTPRYFGDHNLWIVNSLLYTSHIGIGLYIYNSPPVCFAAVYNRLMYSVFGSVVFNFGSLLLWSTLGNNVSRFHPTAKLLLAASCASTLLYVGADYLHFLCAWMRGQP